MASLKQVVVPDIGDFAEVEIIEVSVQPGDAIAQDDSLITLETDKAAMEIPAPFSGTVKELKVDIGDKVSKGSLILTVEAADDAAAAESEPESKPEPETKAEAPAEAPKAEPTKAEAPAKPSAPEPAAPVASTGDIYAGPAVRRLASELNIDLARINGTGRKNRITRDDLYGHIKGQMNGAGGGSGLNIAAMPEVDFAKYGPVESKPLMRIKKLTAQNLHRNWVAIPHVTHFDSADITELENFRKQQKAKAEAEGFKLTPLVFIMKAVVAALKAYPQFNASLANDGANLIYKQYFHIGVAVDTPNGLVVPVVRDVDQKGLLALAQELAEISQKARKGQLTAAQMQGGCFTISSLGGIGGTAFTPIINAPELAILGVSKAKIEPQYNGCDFEPRLMLPLALSYDHRVIDGAEAARFSKFISEHLSDIRNLLM